MASESDRKRARQLEARQSIDGIFGDLLGDEGEPEISPLERLASLSKAPLHVLLMVKSPKFPLEANDNLYINVNKASGRPLGIMQVTEDGRIQTPRGILNSLAAAAKLYQPWNTKKNRWPDGWEAIRRAGATPGSYISLNRLFSQYWESFDLDIDTLIDTEKLAEKMVQLGYLDKEDVSEYVVRRHKDDKEQA